MPRYLITWEIDADASTPEEAARSAWEAMRRPGSTTNVFKVIDEEGNETTVDLQEIMESANE